MKKFIILIIFLLPVVFIACCGDDDDAEKSYTIIVKGFIEDDLTTFNGQYLKSGSESSWTSYTNTSDSTIIDLSSGGKYLVNASKSGYIASPAIDTVEIDSDGGTGYAIFIFEADTGGTAEDYSLSITGYVDGTPTDFGAQHKKSTASIWQDISIDSTGYVDIDIYETGSYLVKGVKSGYIVYPSIDTVIINDANHEGIARLDFIDTTGSGSSYGLHIIGEVDGTRTNFTAQYRHQADDWTEIEVGASGMANIVVDLIGYYYLQAEKGTYDVEPAIDTVYINDDACDGYAEFNFIDTSSSPESYTITIIGEIDGEPLAFDAEYSLFMTSWANISIDESGITTISVPAEGTYYIRAIHDEYSAEPEMISLILSEINPADTARFTFIDTTESTPYWLHLIGEEDGFMVPFTGYYRLLDGSWHNVDIDESGIGSVNLPLIGVYEVYATREGALSYPEMDTIEISETMAFAYSSFEFIDTTGEPEYTLTIMGSLDGEPTDFTAEYRLDYGDYEWRTIDIGSEGETTLDLRPPGLYQVRAYKAGHLIIPELHEITLNSDNPNQTASFALYDSSDYIDSEVIAIYATDRNSNRITKINNMLGSGLQTYGRFGTGVGQFDYLFDVEVDNYNRIYVTDTRNERIVRIDDMTGSGWISLGHHGSGDGEFDDPSSICVSDYSTIVVMDRFGSRIVEMDDMLGNGWSSHPHSMSGPVGVGVDMSGNLYGVENTGHNIIMYDATRWHSFGERGSGEGQLSTPNQLAIDRYNRIYITDGGNCRIVRIDDMSGSGWIAFGTEGSGIGEFRNPFGIDVTPDGKIFIADEHNNRIVKIDDMEGNGWQEYGPEGQFSIIRGIAVLTVE